ncbi:hypothetical protein RZE82_07780 [Mollicutes bacterium LVI A0039]|nr:hypothetical protein RZE82_07780 [Mollicutes bacterium LVI A0039]
MKLLFTILIAIFMYLLSQDIVISALTMYGIFGVITFREYMITEDSDSDEILVSDITCERKSNFKVVVKLGIIIIVTLMSIEAVKYHGDSNINDLPESFIGVNTETNVNFLYVELDVKSNENEFDVEELRQVLVDYKDLITTGERDLFARIKYTYYKETEGYDKYGNDAPNIECSIDFKNNDIKLMNFENITDENIVKIGTGYTFGNFPLPLPINETCFGNEDKETNEAVETQTLIEE